MNKSVFMFPLSLALLFGVLYYIGFETILDSLSSANPYYLFVAFLLNLASFLIWNLKWKYLVDKIKTTGFLDMFPILMAGVFLNNITPAAKTAGGILRTLYLSKLIGERKSRCYAIVALDNLTNYFILSILSFMSILLVFLFLDIPKTLSFALEIVLLAFILVAFSGFYLRKKVNLDYRLLENNLPKIYNFPLFRSLRKKFSVYSSFEDYVISRIESFVSSFEEVARDRGRMKRNIFLAFLVWATLYMKTYILFLAVGYEVSIMTVFIVITISTLLGYFVVVPGGMGVVEISMISLYVASGVNSSVAAGVSVIDRIIFYFLAWGVGYASVLYLNYRYG